MPETEVVAAVPKVMLVDELTAAMVVTSEAPEGPAPVITMSSPTLPETNEALGSLKVVLAAVAVPVEPWRMVP